MRTRRAITRLAPGIGAVGMAIALTACNTSTTTTSANGTTPATSTAPASPGVPDPNAADAVAPGDIPDSQAFVPYAFAGGFSVQVPEGWSRSEDAGAVIFTDKYNSIRLESTVGTSPPTVDSVRASEVPRLSSTLGGFQLVDVTAVSRPAGDGILMTYTAPSSPNPVTGKSAMLAVERYEFWHNGTTAVVTLAGALGADNVDPWKTVTSSVAWT